MKFYIYILCLITLSCKVNNKTYYRDFDFISIKGVDSLDNNNLNHAIEVVEEKNKLIIKVSSSDIFSHNYEEEFIKKANYFYKDIKYDVEDPNQYMREVFYLKNGIGMKYLLSFEDNKPNFCKISEIDFNKNKLRTFTLYGKHIEPSKDLNFDKIKNENDVTFIDFTNIDIENGKLKVVSKIINIKSNEETVYVGYYSGYPNVKINQYWNLYKYFFGKEVR